MQTELRQFDSPIVPPIDGKFCAVFIVSMNSVMRFKALLNVLKLMEIQPGWPPT